MPNIRFTKESLPSRQDRLTWFALAQTVALSVCGATLHQTTQEMRSSDVPSEEVALERVPIEELRWPDEQEAHPPRVDEEDETPSVVRRMKRVESERDLSPSLEPRSVEPAPEHSTQRQEPLYSVSYFSLPPPPQSASDQPSTDHDSESSSTELWWQRGESRDAGSPWWARSSVAARDDTGVRVYQHSGADVSETSGLSTSRRAPDIVYDTAARHQRSQGNTPSLHGTPSTLTSTTTALMNNESFPEK